MLEIRYGAPELAKLDDMRAEVLCLGVFEDERPLRGALSLIDWRLCGLISRAFKQNRFAARQGCDVLIPVQTKFPFDKCLLVGLGASSAFSEENFITHLEHLFDVLERMKTRRSIWEFPGRALNCLSAERSMKLFLKVLSRHPHHEEITLLEPTATHSMLESLWVAEQRRTQMASQEG